MQCVVLYMQRPGLGGVADVRAAHEHVEEAVHVLRVLYSKCNA